MILKDFQHNVINKMLNGAKIINAPVGSGKTIMILEMLKNSDTTNELHLIVTKKLLIKEAFIKDNLNHCNLNLFTTSGNLPNTGIIVTNYEYFLRHKTEFFSLKYGNVFLDEAHQISNYRSKISRLIAGTWKNNGIKDIANNVYMFTATLIPNRKQQIYPLLKLAGYNETWTDFKKEFFYNYIPGIPQAIKFIKSKQKDYINLLNKYVYTVHKEDMDKVQIKNKHWHIIKFEMTKEQTEVYKKIFKNNIYKDVVVKNILTKSLRLRQITNGYLCDTKTNFVDVTTKIKFKTSPIIKKILPSHRLDILFNHLINDKLKNEKHIIIYYSFSFDINNFTNYLLSLPLPLHRYWYFINGFVSAKNKSKNIKDWKKYGGLLFIQFNAGKQGLNLDQANNIIYYNLEDNNESFTQSQGRITRIASDRTQKTPHYWVMVAKNSIDEVIIKALKEKKRVLEEIKKYLKGSD